MKSKVYVYDICTYKNYRKWVESGQIEEFGQREESILFDRFENLLPQTELAKKYALSRTTIYNICRWFPYEMIKKLRGQGLWSDSICGEFDLKDWKSCSSEKRK